MPPPAVLSSSSLFFMHSFKVVLLKYNLPLSILTPQPSNIVPIVDLDLTWNKPVTPESSSENNNMDINLLVYWSIYSSRCRAILANKRK